jgi:HTH-type transcriptional regulator/antitoxin HigA
MKSMRIIALSTLKEFWENNPSCNDVMEPLLSWYRRTLQADWASPALLEQEFRTASVLRDGRVVFNIASNKYRVVVWINYAYRVVYIRFVGTHEQYDRIDVQNRCSNDLKKERTKVNVKVIKTDAEYRAALKDIDSLMTAEADTPEGEMLDLLVTLVEAYERQHYPLDLPDAVAAIRFEMEQKGLTVKDLEPMIGRTNRVYEVLNYKRSLTTRMIWRLHKELGIPAESLIKPAVQVRA